MTSHPSIKGAGDPIFTLEFDEIRRVKEQGETPPPTDRRPLSLDEYQRYVVSRTKRPTADNIRRLLDGLQDELHAIAQRMESGQRYYAVPVLMPNTPGYMGMAPGQEARTGHLHYRVMREDGLVLHDYAPLYLTVVMPQEVIACGALIPPNVDTDADAQAAFLQDAEDAIRQLCAIAYAD